MKRVITKVVKNVKNAATVSYKLSTMADSKLIKTMPSQTTNKPSFVAHPLGTGWLWVRCLAVLIPNA